MNDVMFAPRTGAGSPWSLHRPRLLAAAALAIALVANGAKAATVYYWKSATSGSWNDAAKWTPGGYPGSGLAQDDSAYIDAVGGAYTITHDLLGAANSRWVNRLEINAPSATLHVKGGTASDSWFTTQGVHIGAGWVEFSGRTRLSAGHVTLRDGTLVSNGQLSVWADTINLGAGEIRVGAGRSFDFTATKALEQYAGNFTLAADGRLHLDGPLRITGGTAVNLAAFRNDGGTITGEAGIHFDRGVLVQGRAPASPGGTFIMSNGSYIWGADPSLNQVFEGQTIVIENDNGTHSLEVQDGFRNNGTMIMESSGHDHVFFNARKPWPQHASLGSAFNAGNFIVRPKPSSQLVRAINAHVINEPTGTIDLQASTSIGPSLTNSGTVKMAPGETLRVVASGRLVQKAGTLDVPGTITIEPSGTFVNEGGIITGNPTVRFPNHGTVINDIAEDNGSVVFVLEDGAGHIKRSVSGKVLLGKGQTFTNLWTAESLFVEPEFINHGRLTLAHSIVMGVRKDGLPSATEPITNAGLIEFAAGSRGGSASRIVNQSTGVVHVAGTPNTLAGIENAGSFVVAPSAQATLGDVSNSGTMDVSGTANVAGTFANTGTVSVSWGLRLDGSSSNDGVLEAKDRGVISLIGGTAERPFVNRGTLSLASGTMDLRTQDLINPVADADERESALGMLNDLVASARNGPSGLWSGPGITSSRAASAHRTLAVGATEDAVIVRLTYNGDANLDGLINADDYFRIDQGFLAQPSDPLFSQGDFNYDGQINADDYFLIDQAFLGQGAPLGSASAGALAAVSVPEPSLGLAATAVALSLLRRRRRR